MSECVVSTLGQIIVVAIVVASGTECYHQSGIFFKLCMLSGRLDI